MVPSPRFWVALPGAPRAWARGVLPGSGSPGSHTVYEAPARHHGGRGRSPNSTFLLSLELLKIRASDSVSTIVM